jgi:hypothetical protein
MNSHAAGNPRRYLAIAGAAVAMAGGYVAGDIVRTERADAARSEASYLKSINERLRLVNNRLIGLRTSQGETRQAINSQGSLERQLLRVIEVNTRPQQSGR